jgi:hypothetical protein
MDDDGQEMVEMMAGMSPEAILATIYNGSQTCINCGSLMNPVGVMYGGNRCVDCSTHKSTQRVQNRMS